jgi:hypothetical protein
MLIRLEYRYMQLIENNNPDDDTAIDNVCAQLSDEEDSGEEVQFKTQSKAKKILNVVRNAIRKVKQIKKIFVFINKSIRFRIPEMANLMDSLVIVFY